MKKYLLSLISFILSAICIIAYNIIGSEIAADGALIEPFYLIPIGCLFFGIGIVAFIVPLVISNGKKLKGKC